MAKMLVPARIQLFPTGVRKTLPGATAAVCCSLLAAGLSTCPAARAQGKKTPAPAPEQTAASTPGSPSEVTGANAPSPSPGSAPASLPDSPGALLAGQASAQPQSLLLDAADDDPQHPDRKLPVCPPVPRTSAPEADASRFVEQAPCRAENPVQSFVNSKQAKPLTSRDKGMLAIRDVIDPFNLLTVVGYSGVAIGSNAHSAFGPGLKGWGRLTGYSFVEEAQGEFMGTYLISSLTHEDPRYHRVGHGPLKHRILNAVLHSYVTAHDDGSRMPNYATLLTYPISAELANLYVPGVETDAKSTGRRIAIGLATDPTGTLVAEFLPDLARHIHVRVIFIQEILNQVVTGGTAPNVQ